MIAYSDTNPSKPRARNSCSFKLFHKSLLIENQFKFSFGKDLPNCIGQVLQTRDLLELIEHDQKDKKEPQTPPTCLVFLPYHNHHLTMLRRQAENTLNHGHKNEENELQPVKNDNIRETKSNAQTKSPARRPVNTGLRDRENRQTPSKSRVLDVHRAALTPTTPTKSKKKNTADILHSAHRKLTCVKLRLQTRRNHMSLKIL